MADRRAWSAAGAALVVSVALAGGAAAASPALAVDGAWAVDGAVRGGGSAEVVDGELPEPTTDPADVRARAEKILARPELRPEEPSLFERALDRIAEELVGLLERGLGTGSGMFGWFLLAALLALVAWLVRRISPTAHRTAEASSSPDVVVEEHRSASDWADAARAHEAAGAWVEALRCRYRALVAELVDRDVVRDVPGRTVGEYREEIASARPAAAAPFRAATTLYEDAWYGHRGAGPAEAEEFADGARAVLEEVAR